MTEQDFAFRFTTPYRIAALPFGITPGGCKVRIDDQNLTVRFGRWHVETTMNNIAGATITGPYAFVKTAGPPHLSLSDRGLTFASNGDRGVCIEFHHPVAGIEPTGALRHPSLTVTVSDCHALVNALTR
jgi:hypothetical protein